MAIIRCNTYYSKLCKVSIVESTTKKEILIEHKTVGNTNTSIEESYFSDYKYVVIIFFLILVVYIIYRYLKSKILNCVTTEVNRQVGN